MPTYTFHCPSCLWTGDRIVSSEDRDKQICGAKLRVYRGDPKDPTVESCDKTLEREEIALTARTPLAWKP